MRTPGWLNAHLIWGVNRVSRRTIIYYFIFWVFRIWEILELKIRHNGHRFKHRFLVICNSIGGSACVNRVAYLSINVNTLSVHVSENFPQDRIFRNLKKREKKCFPVYLCIRNNSLTISPHFHIKPNMDRANLID